MSHYSIYLNNQNEETNTYGFFAAPPESEDVGTEVYSNVWISHKLAQDQRFKVDIDKNYYAWCGTAPSTLSPGVKVSIGSSKLADLGTSTTPGSTFYMYNLDSQPVFDTKEGATANPGCFEIDSKDDFTHDLNFLMGLAAPDSELRMVAVASFEAPTMSRVNIMPLLDYYVSAFNDVQGTVINFKEQSRVAAHISFSDHPGYYGANVIHKDNGDFEVTYVPTRDEFLALTEGHKEEPTLEQKVSKLEKQLSTVLKYLPAASAAERKLNQVVPKKANGY